MNDILLFAGTSEGREIAEACRTRHIGLTVSVATEYGETLIEQGGGVRVLHGRKNADEIEALIRSMGAPLVIDATHPYAKEITETLKAVTAKTGTEYLRVVRASEHALDAQCIFVPDTAAAVDALNRMDGNVLLTVGSKELSAYTAVRDWKNRLFARILPVKESAETAFALGFSGSRLICMQGPFSEAMNAAMLEAADAKILVTKDTGAAGGYAEKIRAAVRCGATPIVIRRPTEETGVGVQECIRRIDDRFETKQITVLGVGAGSGQLTEDAVRACEAAQLIVGAPRVTDALQRFAKPVVHAVLPQQIESVLRTHAAKRIVVAMSGDTGFYSGAKGLLLRIPDLHPKVLPGISSVVDFAAKLRIPWDDAALLSVHGRAANVVGTVKTHKKVFLLTGGEQDVSAVLHTLSAFGLGGVSVAVGENLSYENERITRGTAEQLCDRSFDPLAVLFIENDGAAIVTHGRPDADFLRTDVPMTKSEVRAVTLSKMKLTRDAVCWDVGAGTGSVALELAEAAVCGEVYAIEQKAEACELIEQNKRHLGVANVTVVHGTAPEALQTLPAPTHVFIGGSGGNLKDIVAAAFEKNPACRIVLNTVTAETFSEALNVLKTFPVQNEEIVELAVSRARTVGAYHLMTAQNPVYVIAFEGGQAHE